jgi:glucosyl-3-phosphoglycerate synthase
MTPVEFFAEALDRALEDFQQYSFGAPFIPAWRRIEVAIHGIMNEAREGIVSQNIKFRLVN